MSGDERARCQSSAGKHESYWKRPSGDVEAGNRTRDLARLIERERAHAAATTLFVERVAVWLASMAQVGAAVAYHREMAAVKSEFSRRWLKEGP